MCLSRCVVPLLSEWCRTKCSTASVLTKRGAPFEKGDQLWMLWKMKTSADSLVLLSLPHMLAWIVSRASKLQIFQRFSTQRDCPVICLNTVFYTTFCVMSSVVWFLSYPSPLLSCCSSISHPRCTSKVMRWDARLRFTSFPLGPMIINPSEIV